MMMRRGEKEWMGLSDSAVKIRLCFDPPYFPSVMIEQEGENLIN